MANEKMQMNFGIQDISLISKIVNKPDCLIIDEETGTVYDKDTDIENFAIIFDTKPEEYAEKVLPKVKETKRRKKTAAKNSTTPYWDAEETAAIKDIKAEEESMELSYGEEKVDMNDVDKLHLIAKELKIQCASSAMLKTKGWFLVPILSKPMTEFRPVMWEEIKNGYRLVVKSPIFTTLNNPFTEEYNWKYNPIEAINNALGTKGNGLRFSAITVFRHLKDNENNRELKMALKSFENAQKTRIKVGNNLINSLYTAKGSILFNELKDAAAAESNKEVKDTKVIDLIETEYLTLNAGIENDIYDSRIQAKNIMKFLGTIDNDDDEQKKLSEYLSNTKKKRRYVTRLKNEEDFKEAQQRFDLKFISSYCIYNQIREYLNYKSIEDESRSYLFELVHHHPLWNRYLVGIRGCGETMAAYIIANYNIHLTEHPSAFLRYTGLDQVVIAPDENEEITVEQKIRAISLLRMDYIRIKNRAASHGDSLPEVSKNFGPYKTDVINNYEQYQAVESMVLEYNMVALTMIPGKLEAIIADNYNEIIKDEIIHDRVAWITENIVVFDSKTEDGLNIPMIKKVARTKRIRETSTYLNKEGKIETKSCIGYNAVLKGKLLGVLFQAFLKQRNNGSYYIKIYDETKARLIQRPDFRDCYEERGPKGHIHAMARRKTMQVFIEDLWMAWRKIEGLPLNGGTYAEDKLGIHHHQGRVTPKIYASPIKKGEKVDLF